MGKHFLIPSSTRMASGCVPQTAIMIAARYINSMIYCPRQQSFQKGTEKAVHTSRKIHPSQGMVAIKSESNEIHTAILLLRSLHFLSTSSQTDAGLRFLSGTSG